MKLGVIVHHSDKNIEEKIKKVHDMGLYNCQLSSGSDNLRTDEQAEKIKAWCSEYNVEISAVIAGWSGPSVWNFIEGPTTLGLVPAAYRANRIEEIKKSIDFAAKLGARDVNTHIGFIPENLNDPAYAETVTAVKHVCAYAKQKGINFCLETGQETPITLLRLILDTKADNIGINYDPANLLMYGKANPIEGLDIVGKYVLGVHIKDGEYPTNPYELGHETAVSKGMVHFDKFLAKLKEHGYDGALTIEREISGDQQEKDIILARDIINDILEKL